MTPDSDETQELLQRLSNGDRRAFDRLLTMHRSELQRIIELRLDSRLRGRVDPSDVVQEAQLDALGRLNDYLDRRPMPFRLWLRKTTQERLLKVRRRHVEAARRTARREECLPDHSSMQLAKRLFAKGSTPSKQIARRELADRVQQAMARLPKTDREILLMRVLEGLSYEDVGQILEIDPAAARKRYGRALIRLNRSLRDRGLTESL